MSRRSNPMVERVPDEPSQCRQWVKDRRRKRIKAEQERRAQIESREEAEFCNLADKAFSQLPKTHGKPVFSGFGPGVRGGTGRYRLRNGRLVRDD